MNEDISSVSREREIDFKSILNYYLRNWIWFLVALIVAFLVAFLYLRYTSSEYNVSTKVLIKGENGGENSLFADLESFQNNQNISNEIQVLKGKTLMQRVIGELNFNTSCFTEGKIKRTELYGEARPIATTVSWMDENAAGLTVKLILKSGDKFILQDSLGKAEIPFGKEIRRPYAIFTITKSNWTKAISDNVIDLRFNSISNLAYKYNALLKVETINPDASVLNISLVDVIPEKAEDILNKLVEVYNREAIEDKNQIAANTVKFIDERLNYLVTELSQVERNVENYKKKNQIADVSVEAQQYLQDASEYNRKLAEYETQISILESIERYMKADGNRNQLVPSSLGLQDITLASLINKFNEQQLERQRLLRTVQEGSPLVTGVNEQLNSLRVNILENLGNIKRSLIITRNDLEASSGKSRSRIQSVPSIERNLLEIQRQQGIKETLYSYLLQKKEEASISLAATISNSRIIDKAIADKAPVFPKKGMIYLYALSIGLGIPIIVLYLRNALNDKVQSVDDIQKIMDIAVLGEISHSDNDNVLVVTENRRSEIAELFRLIRTNLQFAGGGNQVIIVTSSMSGEGKTFFTINLGASLAITGKKVVLLEFDIRKPKLFKDLGFGGNTQGITNYLVSNDVTIDQLLTPVKDVPGLYAIAAGPLPPNPSELLMNPKIEILINELKNQFDHIIIDTSPVGQVADAFALSKFANLGLYMVRYNYTFKQQLHIIKDIK